ncbi:MAG: O-antigen ligase family protein [Solirubrobacteraceae bacterium]
MATGASIGFGLPAPERQAGAPSDGRATGEARSADIPATWAQEAAMVALMLLPGALIVFTGFNAGGYFPGTPAVVAIVLTQVLLVRILQARRPFEGIAPVTLVAVVALGAYAGLTLASALWSHATGRALIEFDRAWSYLLVLLLFATVRATQANLRWLLRGLAAGIAIVCVAGLATRLAPDVLHTAPDVSNQRLSFPVTYWNTLGLLAAMGIVLAFHLTSSLREKRVVAVLAAGVMPLLAATLFFTFSRGSILAGAIGLAIYVCVARPRGLLSGAIATIPATGLLLVAAYKANLLDTLDPTTPAAVAQGHRVAWVAAGCVAACMTLRLVCSHLLDPRLRRAGALGMVPVKTKRMILGGAGALALVAALALGAPHAVAHEWSGFIGGAPTKLAKGDLRSRLTDPSNDGRTELWQVALNGFDAAPLKGNGAGTYQTLWNANRSRPAYVINAHSLYLQAMAELGLPGFLLLVVLLGAILVGIVVRASGSRRVVHGAVLALAVVWILHAGVDWDWEMPVVTLGVLAAAGLALSPRRVSPSAADPRDPAGEAGVGSGGAPSWVPAHQTRIVLGLLLLVTLVVPVSIVGSESKLGEAEHALYSSDCGAATPAALSSIGWLDVRPEPYEVLGFCDLHRGRPRLAISAMRAAVAQDPDSWEPYYTLAIAQASAGIDPRANVAKAVRLNPLERLTKEAAKQLRGSNPTEWVRRAAIVKAAALASNHLSILPS